MFNLVVTLVMCRVLCKGQFVHKALEKAVVVYGSVREMVSVFYNTRDGSWDLVRG